MTNHLRDERRKRELSPAQLAHVMGWSERTILSLEAGTYYPVANELLRLAKYFNIPAEELFVLEVGELEFKEVPDEKQRAGTFLGFRLPWIKSA